MSHAERIAIEAMVFVTAFGTMALGVVDALIKHGADGIEFITIVFGGF